MNLNRLLPMGFFKITETVAVAVIAVMLLPAGVVHGFQTGIFSTGAVLPAGGSHMTRKQCMKCHPVIASLLRRAGAAHGRMQCRRCHRQFHLYREGETVYQDVLPECERCHEHPHGEELVNCSSCHSEGHTPLEIPASQALAQGCYVCHEEFDREIKTFITRHTELYCTACHHTRHGHIPQCLECHQPHTAIFPARVKSQEPAMPLLLDECQECHPPHSALKATCPDETSSLTCALCHREAYDVLEKSGTKHTALECTRCHPGRHKTIRRCRECHGDQPHPQDMLKQFESCGACHGVAHSIIR